MEFSPQARWVTALETLGQGGMNPMSAPSGGLSLMPTGLPGKAEWSGTIWDAATGDKQMELRGPSSVEQFQFSPDDRYLAMALRDGNVELWDVPGKQHLFDWQAWPKDAATGAPQQSGRYLAFTPDGTSLAVLDSNANRLRFLQLNRLREQLVPVGLSW